MAAVEMASSPLIIGDAYFGGMHCRGQIYEACAFDGYVPISLGFDSRLLVSIMGRDPLPGQVKTLSVLYGYYPENARLFTVTEATGKVNLTKTTTAHSQPPPQINGGSDQFKIIAVTYGQNVITDQLIYDSIYSQFNQGKPWPVNNDSMGGDPQPGVQKTAVMYWTSRGQIQSQSVIEGGTFKP